MIQMKRCTICPNNCLIDNAICGRKPNFDENIVETTVIAIDPIEKKPLYHFLPGTKTLSIGTLGCNLKCLNCQNHSIAQPENPDKVETKNYTPEEIVKLALDNNIKSISWTYNEPTIHPEWIINTAKIAQQHNIKTILVTNGYTSQETLEKLKKYVDAVNVDLKSPEELFYEKVCLGHLEPVLNSINFYLNNKIHLEITTLLITDLNSDSVPEVVETIKELDTNIPIHFSAFYPQHKLSTLPPTDPDLIYDACFFATGFDLKYVYSGNVPHSNYDNTYCKFCDDLLIEREGYSVKNYIENGKCTKCENMINDVIEE